MNWAHKRQLMYFLVVLAVAVLIVVWIIVKVFFSSDPTCFDGKHNADERGVDCGGSCVLVCPNDAQNPVILWSQTARVTDEVYNVVAYVDNQNVAAAIYEIPYEFKLYDQDNVLLAERRGTTFLGPNQRTAIFEPGLIVGGRTPAFTNFEFLATPTWHRPEERFARKLLTVARTELTQLDTRPKLTGQVRNHNTFDMNNIDVVAIVYDQAGNVLATSQTYVDRIAQGDMHTVSFTWPGPFDGVAVRTEIIPRMNPFDQLDR